MNTAILFCAIFMTCHFIGVFMGKNRIERNFGELQQGDWLALFFFGFAIFIEMGVRKIFQGFKRLTK